MATRSSRPPFGGRRRHALIQLSGFGETLRESLEQVNVDIALRTPGGALSQLPTHYGKTLHAHRVRDVLLREVRGEAQLSAHARRRQDIVQAVQQGIDLLQAVR